MNLFKFVVLYFLLTASAIAAPGAHGPDGEHLDGAGGHVHRDAGPRVETFTESFELVGRLQADELSILIDRYETNEPVLNAKLEVDLNGLKALAKFHADHGDYAVDEEHMLKALAKPGKHALIFTLTAGNESDLLEGTLIVSDEVKTEDHSHFPWGWSVVALFVVAVLLFAIIRFRRRKKSTGNNHA
ncbi:hypothetical protein [Herminiimonas fonticola]|uniref:Secreted protein with PEP-CTERM sorting signal n=1 Tax=Herminiimonas fonticola TaxID=303380 RepID=A0A4R6G5D8_9BURK|nr:hypothetical protein [Herminiimonas fonticola]RBA23664.1 hypothetical protein Hfont_1476 [Herminiimonas fonticola]TDN89666.1 hypothetical protein EV677_1726 [Herminiimonas fonticola]